MEVQSPKVLGLIPILPCPRPPPIPGLKAANMDEGIWERRAGRDGETMPATGPAAGKEQGTKQKRGKRDRENSTLHSECRQTSINKETMGSMYHVCPYNFF